MNLRDIKKDIDYVFSAYLEDCSVAAAINSNTCYEEIGKLYEEAIALYNSLRDKAGASVEGPKKAYFNALRKEICESVDALYTKLSAAVKAAVKE